MPKVFKSQLIEVVNTGIAGGNTATRLQFQDFPYLRGRQIFGIEVLNNQDMSFSPTGKALPTPAQAAVSYLTLYLDDLAQGAKNVGEWIQNVPFASMHRIQNSYADTTTFNKTLSSPFVRQMFEMTGQIVYWEKCYLSFASALSNTTDVSFCFIVYFK